MAKEKDEGPPIGLKQLGRRRPERRAAQVASRVARLMTDAPVVEGVTPLNAGFFQLERMRAGAAAKARAKRRAKIRGK